MIKNPIWLSKSSQAEDESDLKRMLPARRELQNSSREPTIAAQREREREERAEREKEKEREQTKTDITYASNIVPIKLEI